jgi:hypothetical protein
LKGVREFEISEKANWIRERSAFLEDRMLRGRNPLSTSSEA